MAPVGLLSQPPTCPLPATSVPGTCHPKRVNGHGNLLVDLGYDDLGFRNGHKTITPAINELVAEGIVLSHYHTYKVCGPSRASIMTGRYPWGIGYYDMTGQEAVSLEYTLIPEVLQASGWKTAAIGKVNRVSSLCWWVFPNLTRPAVLWHPRAMQWDLGAWTKRYTPTFRGFGSFVGYYNAALKDYWYHGGTCSKACAARSTDLSNSSGLRDPAGVRHASDSVNGTYDSEIFTAEALRVLREHGSSADVPGLYIYLAYQNVHTTAQVKTTVSGQQPFQAPCATVDEHYSHAATDAVKVLGAMVSDESVARCDDPCVPQPGSDGRCHALPSAMNMQVTELDYGIGNVTAALKAAGRDWVMLLVSGDADATFVNDFGLSGSCSWSPPLSDTAFSWSDNGGPIDLGNSNSPLRGGKHTL